MEASIMTKRQQKNHQESRKPLGLQTGKLISSDGFQKQYSLLWKTDDHYGAPYNCYSRKLFKHFRECVMKKNNIFNKF